MANLRTALFDAHVAHNARIVPFAGWDMPVQYTGVIDEHKAVRSAVGMFDVSHMARLVFRGPHAEQLLEQVYTNSVATMKLGQVRYGLICKPDGGILDDVLVYKHADHFAMVANASNREKIVNWLNQNTANHDVSIRDETDSTALIAIQGPKAIEIVKGLFADDVTTLKYYFAMPSKYRDQACMVSRTGYTGEDGFEAQVPNTLARHLWDELLARGAVPCGLGARDTLRLEAAMPLYGHELNETIDPLQAGLEWAVKLNKGEFIGRQALQDAKESEAFRPRRIGLLLEGKRAARQGCALLADESTPIGVVTSGSYCPHLDQSLAMGYTVPKYGYDGMTLLIEVRGSLIPAKIVPLPFYKRAK
jgi:aminomethyltransferase